MATEVWFRNPLTYIREIGEMLEGKIVWDRGLLVKQKVDPERHLQLHLPSSIEYRILLVGDQGTAELRRGHGMKNPYAVYPTWEYGEQTISELETMLAEPQLPKGPVPDECGVEGQEHRVVIIRPPNTSTSIGESFVQTLRELQEDYPDAIIHYHGSYSFRTAFGLGFRAADIDPVSWSARGRIVLGSGKYLPWEEAGKYQGWVALNGYSIQDLGEARQRTMFNMRSAMWAGEKFTAEDRFRVRPLPEAEVDWESPTFQAPPARRVYDHVTPQEGDRFLCDRCSIAPTCKFHRVGGVCVISGSEATSLAKHFGTRDAGAIIDGLGAIMKVKVERVEKAVDAETPEDELDPAITKALKDVFDDGVKLAKLIDPSRSGGLQVNVGVVNGQTAVGAGQGAQQALVAKAIAELEEAGVERADIDTEMVVQYLANQERSAIEATAS